MDQKILDITKSNSGNAEELKFISETPQDELQIEHLLGGVLNYVYRIKAGSKQVIVKHAEPYARLLGPEHPMTVKRIEIDHKGLVKFDSILSGSVPRPYHFDLKNHTLFMEDLHDFQNLKEQMLNGDVVDIVAMEKLGAVIGKIHSATHVTKLNEKEFKEMEEMFQDEVVNDAVKYRFAWPWDPKYEVNKIADEVKPRLSQIYGNAELMGNIEKFRRIFTEKKECLIHGDLSPDAVMVKDCVPKIFDFEYAFVGPPAMDLAMFVVYCIVAYHKRMLTCEDNDKHRRIAYKILDACHKFVAAYFENMTAFIGDKEEYKENLMSEVTGFVGIELIAKMIGAFHVQDIVNEPSTELEVLDTGIRLLQAHGRIPNIDRLLFIGLMLC